MSSPRPLALAMTLLTSLLVASTAAADPAPPAPRAEGKAQSRPEGQPGKASSGAEKVPDGKAPAPAEKQASRPARRIEKSEVGKARAGKHVDVGNVDVQGRSTTPYVQFHLERAPLHFAPHELVGPYPYDPPALPGPSAEPVPAPQAKPAQGAQPAPQAQPPQPAGATPAKAQPPAPSEKPSGKKG